MEIPCSGIPKPKLWSTGPPSENTFLFRSQSEDVVVKGFIAIIALTAVLLIPLHNLSSGGSAQAPVTKADNEPVVCSVMEVFEDGKLGVRAVIFHQRDKADGPRLGALLLAHAGEEMELQAPGGPRYRATVFRVKSAFGRGLVMTPVGRFKLAAQDQFSLRLPEKH